MPSVAILGGGVAGLSAAHELIERGFDVTVLEARDLPGGKARSLPVPGSGTDGREDLPGEHGFRFFPGFYRHLPDTMRRIPVAGQPGGVLDNLVGATRVLLAQAGGRNEVVGPGHAPESVDDIRALAAFIRGWAHDVGVPAHEQAFFVERLLTLLTSCDERRFEQWERQSWWEFSAADRRSATYGKFLADGLTRTLVAARAREMSARTGGFVLLQLLFDLSRAGGRADRVLDAPTNDAWLTPWAAHLTQRGVDLRLEAPVVGIGFDGSRITGVSAEHDGVVSQVQADHYIAALPVERLRVLISPELRAADPALARLDRLVTRWMNGVMFYLDRDVPLVHGHALYIDSEWALTSISQAQFWGDVDLGAYGDGSDFVRTSTDLATMEGANEAARRAVNAILDRTGSPAKRCDVWKLREPAIFAPARLLDRVRWRLGRRAARPPVRVTDSGDIAPRGVLGRAVLSRPAAMVARVRQQP